MNIISLMKHLLVFHALFSLFCVAIITGLNDPACIWLCEKYWEQQIVQYQRMLKVPWTDKISNEDILQRADKKKKVILELRMRQI
jgi:hypothetical protein